MHEAVLDYVAAAIAQHDLGGDVLDIGGRDVNGSPRSLFADAASYTVVDALDGPNVNIVADAATLDLDERFDVVMCTEVLEHTPVAADICATAHRHLVRGGCFIATMAGEGRHPHSAIVEGPLQPGEFYANVTEADLTAWLSRAGFASWTIDRAGLDLRAVAFA